MGLELELRTLVREVVLEVLNEERGPAPTQLQAELLTYKQAGERFSVSPRTLSKWVKAGRLRAYGKGRLTRFRVEDVKKCMEASASTPGAPAEVPDVKSKVTSILDSLQRRAR